MANLLNVIQYGAIEGAAANHPIDIMRIDTFVLGETFSATPLKVHNPFVKRLVFSCNAPCWISILSDENGTPDDSNKILLTQNFQHSFKTEDENPIYIKAASAQ